MIASVETAANDQVEAIRILVVEDDVNLLDGIRSILEIEGYQAITAQNGVEALKVLDSEITPPNLIVSDIMMPQMSGTDLLEAVRKESRWVSVPFIFLTARGEKADIQKGKQLGVDDYVVKPYDPVDLLIAIKSRLKRHEDIETQHADAVEQLKRSILTILNHEFRTPLTFVVAYADLLNTPLPDTLETVNNKEEMLLFLKGISSGAERLRSLIENFILLVELETGEAKDTFNLRKKPITDLPALLETARSAIFNAETVRHVCIQQIDDTLTPFIGDTEYLQKAIQHLLSNAVKFSPEGSTVTLRAYAAQGNIFIEVADQGRGIPPEELQNIWRSFYQVNRNFYEDQGAGSGLAIVRRVAELHNGSVSVQSEVGVGSTFTLRIPIRL
jgi:signal transduction histidine kinase